MVDSINKDRILNSFKQGGDIKGLKL